MNPEDPLGAPIPPRPQPPLPPSPELIKPGPGRLGPGLTPMMDFFQRRLESLEKELSLERERAANAQALLQQQDSLRSEVDSQLKDFSVRPKWP